jgi:hypothetical protein
MGKGGQAIQHVARLREIFLTSQSGMDHNFTSPLQEATASVEPSGLKEQ